MLQISLVLTALLLQGPSLDSPTPKERQAAIEQMAKPGNIEAIPAFEAAMKKEGNARRDDLSNAKQGIQSLARIYPDFGGERWKPQFEQLQSEIDKAMKDEKMKVER